MQVEWTMANFKFSPNMDDPKQSKFQALFVVEDDILILYCTNIDLIPIHSSVHFLVVPLSTQMLSKQNEIDGSPERRVSSVIVYT